ncbi:MAG: GatB/YqeY domain-containing protein [Candidatus Buchananbacteria bacterium]
MLDQQINEAFLTAYKAKNESLVSTLRLLKSAIANKKIEKLIPKEEPLSDEDVLAVLKSEVKKRQDSIVSYKQGNREELAAKEQAEIDLIAKFLPEQLSEDQVRELVKKVIAEQGNPGPAGFGKIMGAVMAAAKGAADGTVVSRIVKEELGK